MKWRTFKMYVMYFKNWHHDEQGASFVLVWRETRPHAESYNFYEILILSYRSDSSIGTWA